MPQVISSNIASLNAQRHLNTSQSAVGTALQRLSSGLRINSARDDAAGLAISERMTTQIRGLSQAARNANDGISLLQTAEGALSSVTGNLQRIRELSVQAANGTNSTSDRQALQVEVAELIAEIDRVGRQTQFNGTDVFYKSTRSVVGDDDQLAVLDGLQIGWLENAEKMVSDYFGISGDGAAMSIELTTFTDGNVGANVAARVTFAVGGSGKATNLKLQVDMANFTPPNLPNGGTGPVYNDRIIAHEMAHAVMARSMNFGDLFANNKWFVEGMAEFIQGADERLNVDYAGGGGLAAMKAAFAADNVSASVGYSAGYAAVKFLHHSIKNAGGDGIRDITEYLAANQSATLDDAISNASSGAFADEATFNAAIAAGGGAFDTFVAGLDLSNTDTGAIGGLDTDGGPILTAESVVNDVGTRSGTDVLSGFLETFEEISTYSPTTSSVLQVGANSAETIDIGVGAMNAAALGIDSTDLVSDPSRAILQMDRALEYINTARARIGAQLNRLDSTVTNLQTTTANLSASRSRIQDADFAQETAALTRAQVLQQAGVAMLAQANAVPQNVITLLR